MYIYIYTYIWCVHAYTLFFAIQPSWLQGLHVPLQMKIFRTEYLCLCPMRGASILKRAYLFFSEYTWVKRAYLFLSEYTWAHACITCVYYQRPSQNRIIMSFYIDWQTRMDYKRHHLCVRMVRMHAHASTYKPCSFSPSFSLFSNVKSRQPSVQTRIQRASLTLLGTTSL